jgi:hypothetical protein
MRDAAIYELAGRQFNRISRRQLLDLGLTGRSIEHRVATGRLVATEQGVFALPPVLDDRWGRWMGATLTAPCTYLSYWSAAAARELWRAPLTVETVSRPGSGGVRRHGGVLVHRSLTLAGDTTVLRGIPLTTVARTIVI